MFRTKTIVGTLLTLTAAAICVYLSFGPSGSAIQVSNALAVAFLVICPVLHLRRERRRVDRMSAEEAAAWRENAYEGPGDTSIAVTLAITTITLGLLALSPSRWPAALAFALVFSLTNLLVSPRKPLRSLLVALAATCSLWPVEDNIASRFENRLSIYLARLTSDRLDSHSVLNVPQGRTLRTLGGQVDVGTVDGRLPGLRFGAIMGAALAVYLKRNTLHVLLMTISGWFWATALTGFYYYGLSSKQNSGGFLEGLWAYPAFILAIGAVLLISTDQLWLVLGIFNPFTWFSRDRKRVARKQDAPESSAESDLDDAAEDEPQRRELPGWVFTGIGVAALVVAVLDAGVSFGHLRQNRKVDAKWKEIAESTDRSFMPERIGRWVRSEPNQLVTTTVPSRDASLVNTFYAAGESKARVAYVGTYANWYDRYQDFQLAGWNSRSQRVVNDTARGLSYVVNDLSLPTGEHCTLIYEISAIDGRENGKLTATARTIQESLLWEFFQSLFFRKSWSKDFYLTEVAFESYGPLTTAESQLLDELVRGVFDANLPSKLRSIE